MKTKALLAALFVAGLAVSMAVAAPAERGKGTNGTTAAESGSTGGTTTGETGRKGKGKRQGHGRRAECRPNRAALVVGDFVAAGDASFTIDVRGGNRVGKTLAGKQVTVSVTDRTKLRRNGKAALADLAAGDLLLVMGKACKLDAQALTLVAKQVVVLSPSDDEDDDEQDGADEHDGTTSTVETTSESP